MTKFIILRDTNGYSTSINVNAIVSYIEFKDFRDIELSTGTKITTKLTFDEIKSLIDNA